MRSHAPNRTTLPLRPGADSLTWDRELRWHNTLNSACDTA